MTKSKTELRLTPHSEIPGAMSCELWYEGVFVGTVVGADGPGVRVISKHQLSTGTIVTLPAPTTTGVIHIQETRIVV